jgi:hypothetical protein
MHGRASRTAVAVADGLVLVGLTGCGGELQVEQQPPAAPALPAGTATPGGYGEPGAGPGGGMGGRGGEARTADGDAGPDPGSDQLVEQPCADVTIIRQTYRSTASFSSARYPGIRPSYATTSCAAGFKIDDRFYSISCGAVRPDKVHSKVFASGRYYAYGGPLSQGDQPRRHARDPASGRPVRR